MNPISFPTSLSDEEHALKEIHEKLKLMRRLLAERKNAAAGEVSSIEKNRVKKSVEDAAVATEELKKKVIAGAITVKKVSEKHTFKRAKVDRKARTNSACEEGEIDCDNILLMFVLVFLGSASESQYFNNFFSRYSEYVAKPLHFVMHSQCWDSTL
ncbi:unnamed protein product [Haemonchus placei]|uniref:Uncharacterized protein n=1 Tax=Haemonchus placei TaxID=6290 RepID=A0A0N4WTS7_HAEPC|nr:unnamed protein product [Haemonchus placei]